MSEKYKFHDPEGIYFVTPTIVVWADLFTKQQYWHIVLGALAHYQQNNGLIIHAWCVMSSHLHLIISTRKSPLSDIMRDFKKYTSKRFTGSLKDGNDSRREWLLRLFAEAGAELKRNKNFKVWQDGNHPILLDNNQMITQRLEYVHNNPVEAGLVQDPTDYLLSSARDYADEPGLLQIEKLA